MAFYHSIRRVANAEIISYVTGRVGSEGIWAWGMWEHLLRSSTQRQDFYLQEGVTSDWHVLSLQK